MSLHFKMIASVMVSFFALFHLLSATKCDTTVECPVDQTCCKMMSGGFGCCPLPNAVCCMDGKHCCPWGEHCHKRTGKCEK